MTSERRPLFSMKGECSEGLFSASHRPHLLFALFFPGPTMSSEVQRPDDSPSTSGGSSDIEQRESVATEQEREQAQPKKKETKISSKTAAKLSTSAKRYKAVPKKSFHATVFLENPDLCCLVPPGRGQEDGVTPLSFRIQKELAEITLDPPPNCR